MCCASAKTPRQLACVFLCCLTRWCSLTPVSVAHSHVTPICHAQMTTALRALLLLLLTQSVCAFTCWGCRGKGCCDSLPNDNPLHNGAQNKIEYFNVQAACEAKYAGAIGQFYNPDAIITLPLFRGTREFTKFETAAGQPYACHISNPTFNSFLYAACGWVAETSLQRWRHLRVLLSVRHGDV